MACYIVGAGDFDKERFSPKPGDYIIAADGGYEYLSDKGIKPDLVLGDFDSLVQIPEHENLIKYPSEKDDTDMMIAIKRALLEGHTQIYLFGGVGGRLDHTLANIQSLIFISRSGGNGYLIGNGMEMTVLIDGVYRFDAENKGILSVFSMDSKAIGIDLIGLKYPLKDAVLTNDMPLGISNEFIGKSSEVRVKKGTLLLIWNY